MGPWQQWRASERVDNRGTDPCSMLDSTTRLLSFSGLIYWELRAYLTVPAWQRSYTPMSVPKVQKPLYSLVCVEKAMGERKAQGEDGGDNLAHGSCLRPVDLEMRRSIQDERIIIFLISSSVSLRNKKNIFLSQNENKVHFRYSILYMRQWPAEGCN